MKQSDTQSSAGRLLDKSCLATDYPEEPKYSKAFWRKLSDLLPEYKESKAWLKKNQMELVLKEEDIF